ncbi:hypothetical protein ES703_83439 [subsurface metagenome]
MENLMNKETIKQVIKESQKTAFPKIVPRGIEIPLSKTTKKF